MGNKNKPAKTAATRPSLDLIELQGQRMAADDRFTQEVDEELQSLRALTDQEPGLTLDEHILVEDALANLAVKRSAGALMAARGLRSSIQTPENND